MQSVQNGPHVNLRTERSDEHTVGWRPAVCRRLPLVQWVERPAGARAHRRPHALLL